MIRTLIWQSHFSIKCGEVFRLFFRQIISLYFSGIAFKSWLQVGMRNFVLFYDELIHS